mgnify:CR=1 FL=1
MLARAGTVELCIEFVRTHADVRRDMLVLLSWVTTSPLGATTAASFIESDLKPLLTGEALLMEEALVIIANIVTYSALTQAELLAPGGPVDTVVPLLDSPR